jgi:hypothetical protein
MLLLKDAADAILAMYLEQLCEKIAEENNAIILLCALPPSFLYEHLVMTLI